MTVGPIMSAYEELLTMADVAAFTKVPVGTLKKWRHASTPDRPVGPRSFKLGGSVRYRRADVLAWVSDEYAAAVGVGVAK